MVKENIFKKASIILAFLSSFVIAQQNEFVQFEGFKKTGFHTSGMLYLAAQVEKADYKKFGFENKASLSGRIGLDYIFNHTKEFSFRTGIYMDLIPYYNFDFYIPIGYLPDDYGDYYASKENVKDISHLAFTIPILFEAKKEMGENIFFSISAGLDITLLRYGAFEVGYWFSNSDESELREVFGVYGYTKENWFTYPGLRISPGFYFIFDKVLYQLNFTYKKSLMSYFKGEYQFANLETEIVRGDYKMTGDYIGLGVSVFFKKSKKTNHY